MSSYVIEINLSKHRERIGESLNVDDAGAEETHSETNVPEVRINESNESSSLDKENIWTTQELEKDVSKQMELELLDEDIKLWSDGKELNIRLLLATLHHILCQSSGWIMIPLTNLKDSPDVRKAYQKARLCLHPDKLQQGATISQKYVAEKAFPILQDAWAAFISQDVLLSIT
ncbi:J domain-containing protein required for chloroplast accumulation response 1-like [Bidens hawaiensis]|uniref:J domain-containing protein required for chloroplast accumulation response 1-like n=1 Tax=Bidens hawaiensis TaxID=980011 RepID=UPI00404AC356